MSYNRSGLSYSLANGYRYDMADTMDRGPGLGLPWGTIIGGAIDLGRKYIGGGSTPANVTASGKRRWMDFTPRAGEGRLPSPSPCAGAPSGAEAVQAMQNAPDAVVRSFLAALNHEYSNQGAAVMPTVAELRDPNLPADKWVSLAMGGDDCRHTRGPGLPQMLADIIEDYGGPAFPSSAPMSTVPLTSTGGGSNTFPSTTGPGYSQAPPAAAPNLAEMLKEAARSAGRTVLGPDPQVAALEAQLELQRLQAAQAAAQTQTGGFAKAAIPIAVGAGLIFALARRGA